jgi:DNA-binding NtrC family response regulator
MSDLPPFILQGSSAPFQRAVSTIHKFAAVGATVLIEGETGTGKEMAARAIHYLGARRDGPFIPVNCGALAETLLESELFGHERGAFTDAKSCAPGLVSQADGGTLFLDEIDALSPKAQAALLRFLQDRSYRRVGSAITRQADVRILAASNADLEQMVIQRQFRRDLMYRLNVLMLRMPALRERGADALELAQAFLKRHCQHYRQPARTLHPSFVEFLLQYSWPGNVRELENVIHRAFLMCEGDELVGGVEDRRSESRDEARVGIITNASANPGIHATAPTLADSFKSAKAHAVADFEQRYVQQAMQQSQGNITLAARLAGQDRSAFGKLVRKHCGNGESGKAAAWSHVTE